jgi:hypothetical protein
MRNFCSRCNGRGKVGLFFFGRVCPHCKGDGSEPPPKGNYSVPSTPAPPPRRPRYVSAITIAPEERPRIAELEQGGTYTVLQAPEPTRTIVLPTGTCFTLPGRPLPKIGGENLQPIGQRPAPPPAPPRAQCSPQGIAEPIPQYCPRCGQRLP